MFFYPITKTENEKALLGAGLINNDNINKYQYGKMLGKRFKGIPDGMDLRLVSWIHGKRKRHLYPYNFLTLTCKSYNRKV